MERIGNSSRGRSPVGGELRGIDKTLAQKKSCGRGRHRILQSLGTKKEDLRLDGGESSRASSR